MNSMIPQNHTRPLKVGAFVRLRGGRVTWEVVSITPVEPEVVALNPGMPVDPYVGLRSTSTGKRRTAMAGELSWPDTGERVWPPRREQSVSSHGTGVLDWSADDRYSDVVVGWAAPVLDGHAQEPSAVALCVTVDDRGRWFLRMAADGPDGTVWVGKDAARDLALAILNQVRQM